jgi:hypothetical protein
MTFESPEVRHEFHQLPTGIQVAIQALWIQFAKLNYFIHVEESSGEILLRLHADAKRGHSLDDDSL